MADPSARRFAPAADRNRDAILSKLREILSPRARVLELGSGTGQHAACFTAAMPGWTWQPTDADATNVASIDAYRDDRENFLPARRLDVRSPHDWPEGPYDAVFSANVIHISPWDVALALLDGAVRVLEPTNGALILYGPFRFSGAFTAESNAAFDARLRDEDPEWGVRDVEDVTREATLRGFVAPIVHAMPVNNHVLVFRRGG